MTQRSLLKDSILTRRNRLRGFDYGNPGFYFLTACTHERRNVLGQVANDVTVLSGIGQIVEDAVIGVVAKTQPVQLDSFVIMPNHIHLLIYISLDNRISTVPGLMKQIKGVSAAHTRRERLLVQGPLWQKGFHDEIIRDDLHLNRVRTYIADNPRKWLEDEYMFPN